MKTFRREMVESKKWGTRADSKLEEEEGVEGGRGRVRPEEAFRRMGKV